MNGVQKQAAKAAGLVLAVFFGLVAATGFRGEQRRPCGHIKSFREQLSEIVPIPRNFHCCSSAKLIVGLRDFWLLQRIFRVDHGRWATNLMELENGTESKLRIIQPFRFETRSDDWRVIVERTEMLAGNYLLESSGRIFFREDGIPTTNDLWLNARMRGQH